MVEGEDYSTPPAFRPPGRCALRSALRRFAPSSNLFSVLILPDLATEGYKTMVEGGGFEPPKAEPSDLQSDPFDRSGTPPNETGDYEYIATISQLLIYELLSPACQ